MSVTLVFIARVCLIVIIALIILVLFLIAPGRASAEQRAPFDGRNFAHRGLYLKDQSIPENSLPAFKRAVDAGYGIEFDVHIMPDGELVVFHDDDTARACGEGGELESRTPEELRRLRLFGTENAIPALAEVLAVVAGRVPLIVELKTGHDNENLCRKVYEMMKDYSGEWCVESFDPWIVLWFRRNAPGVLRGQLSSSYSDLKRSGGKIAAFGLSRLLSNALTRPQFIAYGIGPKNILARLCEAMGAMKVAWTSLNETTEKSNDVVIFQFYTPRVKFKE